MRTLDGGAHPVANALTERGRREAGLWPNRDDHVSALIAALEAAVEQAPEGSDRTKTRKLLDAVKGAPQRIVEAAVAGVISGSIT